MKSIFNKKIALINFPQSFDSTCFGENNTFYNFQLSIDKDLLRKIQIDKIIVWENYSYANELARCSLLNDKIYIVLPINIEHSPLNTEFICYKILHNHFDLNTDLIKFEDICAQKYLHAEFNDIINIYNLSKDGLSKTITPNKVAVIFDGDEDESDKIEIAKKAKRDNPNKKIIIKNIYTDKNLKTIKKSCKLFAKYEIFEFCKVYTIKSVAALYLSLFSQEIILQNKKINIVTAIDSPNSFDNKLISYFYNFILKNTKFHNKDSLLNDIFFPFARYMNKDIKLRKNISSVYRFIHNQQKRFNIFSVTYLKTVYNIAITLSLVRKKQFPLVDSINSTELENNLLIGHPSKSQQDFLEEINIIKRIKNKEVITKKCIEYANSRQHELAAKLIPTVIENGIFSERQLSIMIMNCFQQADFRSGLVLSKLGEKIFFSWNKGWFEFTSLRFLLLIGYKQLAWKQLALFAFSYTNGFFNLSKFRLNHKLNRIFGKFNWEQIFSLIKLKYCPQPSIQRAKLLLNIDEYAEAEKILSDKKNSEAATMLFEHYLYVENFIKAKELLTPKLNKPKENIEKSLEYYIAVNDIEGIKSILRCPEKIATIKKYRLLYLAYILIGNINLAFRAFAKSSHFHIIDKYFPNSFIPTLYSDMETVQNAVVLSECFVGDELRYSRLYPEILKLIKAKDCVFTCDRRLYHIFKRTFPNLNFYPLNKTREADIAEDLTLYDKLPGLECARFFDNKAWGHFKDYDRVTTVVGALSAVLKSYQQLAHLPLLKCDSDLADKFKTKIQEIKEKTQAKYVGGLSFRSSITDKGRAKFFLNKTFIKKLLELPDITWINCQYDGLEEPEQNFFASFTNFLNIDVDQYDDIESTAALYANLDIMVTAPTYSGDLAAAVGTHVLCPVTTDEYLIWCKPNTNISLFDNCYEYIPCKTPEDTDLLLKNLYKILERKSEDMK